MNKNLIIGLLVIIVVGVGGYFLVYGKKTATQGNIYQPVTSNSTTQDTTGARQISISAKEFAFSQSTINITKGEKVAIVFTNDGTFSHNFTIADLGLATKTIAPGESDTLIFTPSQSGSFGYACTVDSHKDRGMSGTLVVQ